MPMNNRGREMPCPCMQIVTGREGRVPKVPLLPSGSNSKVALMQVMIWKRLPLRMEHMARHRYVLQVRETYTGWALGESPAASLVDQRPVIYGCRDVLDSENAAVASTD
jgi:hypothetical protein